MLINASKVVFCRSMELEKCDIITYTYKVLQLAPNVPAATMGYCNFPAG